MNGTSASAGQGAAYGIGVGVAVLAALLIVWTTIVRDDGSGAGNFMIILAAAVGAFAAWFRPAGMARAMVGVAAMQCAMGLLTATAPIVARVPGESLRSLVFAGVFAALWLVAAACFRAAARRERPTGPAQPVG